MKHIIWVLVIAFAGGFAYWIWTALQRLEARRKASEERFASFMAQTMKTPLGAPVPAPATAAAATASAVPAPPHPVAAAAAPAAADLASQRLLFEAAGKAAEAGEPALSIQLYARLIARYPAGALVAQARAAAEKEKAKLVRH